LKPSRFSRLTEKTPWLGQALLVAFVLACGIFPMTDTDVWWHLSAGRWIWEQRALPRVDPFCASSLGRPWLDAQWGFQLLLYPLWKLGGGLALVLAKSLAFAAIFALVFARGWTLRTAPFLFALGTFAAFHARHLADVRPVWVTVLLLAWQYRLLRDHLDGRARLPWAGLVASQLVMTQMQGLYWLGPAQFAALCLATGAFRGKPLRLLGGGMVVASLANPLLFFQGARAWSFPLELFARILPVRENLFSREVAENVPFWRWLAESPGAAFPFLFMAACALLLLAAARSRETRGEALIIVMYGTLGAMAQRNLLLFVLAFLIVASRVAPILAARAHASSFGFRAAVAFALTWSLMSLAGYAADLRAAWTWENRGPKSAAWETPFRFPQGAVAYLRKQPLRGNLFNEMRHGGYIGWHLWPVHLPFIDGRMILHDEGFMREFLGLFDHPGRFEEYRRRHGIEIVLLPIGEDDRYLNLAAHLAADKGETARDTAWSVLYCDGAEVLLARPAAWRGSIAPPAWTPGDGDASAEVRFGGNPRLLRRAEERIALFLERVAHASAASSRSSAGLLDQVLRAEEATIRQFPALASPGISLRDSLDKYERSLRASGLAGLPDSLRAEVLARFLFDTLGLRSVDAGEDLGLSLPARVLRERKGSCVGLALLLMVLAERTGVEARPVFLPGHIFVRLQSGPSSWRNVELLRGGIAREDSFYAEVFQLRKRPWHRLVSREPAQALAALYFNRANAQRSAGRTADALRDYREAERLLPGFPEALGSEAALRKYARYPDRLR
jgi:hypothetical protein